MSDLKSRIAEHGETEYDHRPYEFCRKCHEKIPAEDKHCYKCADNPEPTSGADLELKLESK